MDPAFLRRLPYKIEIAAPSLQHFHDILVKETGKYLMELTDPVFDQIVYRITQEKGLELAAYHPRFIVEQVVATCRFLGMPIHLNPRFIDHAIDNLRVRRADSQTQQPHGFTHARI
jgi:SpoVK/Ycf46/Vps4 family AAA+-type ATPase